MVGYKYLGNARIINAKCMAMRDGVLAARDNDFLYLEIDGDSQVI